MTDARLKEAILRYRAKNKITQEELAKQVKLSRKTIVMLENHPEEVARITKLRLEEHMKEGV